LYGCVQASKLWYEKLRKFLQAQGYVRCDVDPCVLRRVVGSKVYLLLVYVDDILIIADAEELERLEREFVSAFKWITMSVGPSHSYIGMQIGVFLHRDADRYTERHHNTRYTVLSRKIFRML
jgi:hypothetical protein